MPWRWGSATWNACFCFNTHQSDGTTGRNSFTGEPGAASSQQCSQSSTLVPRDFKAETFIIKATMHGHLCQKKLSICWTTSLLVYTDHNYFFIFPVIHFSAAQMHECINFRLRIKLGFLQSIQLLWKGLLQSVGCLNPALILRSNEKNGEGGDK